jgi:hypothetical protein
MADRIEGTIDIGGTIDQKESRTTGHHGLSEWESFSTICKITDPFDFLSKKQQIPSTQRTNKFQSPRSQISKQAGLEK